MSDVRIDQAFTSELITFNAGLLPIAHENTSYAPTTGTAYAELRNLPNNITPFSLNDSVETDGIFRVILRYPADSGAIAAKLKAQSIMDYFFIGRSVCYNGLCSTVVRLTRSSGIIEDSWFRVDVSIGYRTFIKRTPS